MIIVWSACSTKIDDAKMLIEDMKAIVTEEKEVER
jgi:hypothetical protein